MIDGPWVWCTCPEWFACLLVEVIMKCIIPLVYCSFDLMKIQFVLWFMARLICVPVNNQLILFRCGKEPVHSDLTGLILASCNKWCLQIRDIHCVYFFPARDPPKKFHPSNGNFSFKTTTTGLLRVDSQNTYTTHVTYICLNTANINVSKWSLSLKLFNFKHWNCCDKDKIWKCYFQSELSW